MGDSLELYRTLMTIFCQYLRTGDQKPHIGRIKTMAWCVIGLLLTEKVHVPQWASLTISSAQQAASRERRIYRWLHSKKVEPDALYQPLLQTALRDWQQHRLYVALDTTTLWGRFTVVYLSVIYRGRAVPIVWHVLRSSTAAVRLETVQPLMKQAAQYLPAGVEVVLLADRGFFKMGLFKTARDLHWHFRIRIKSVAWVSRPGQMPMLKVARLCPKPGEARFFHRMWLGKERLGPVHLAIAWSESNGKVDPWYVVSDQRTDLTTFDEYGLRFDIEELFLDEKSANFQFEIQPTR